MISQFSTWNGPVTFSDVTGVRPRCLVADLNLHIEYNVIAKQVNATLQRAPPQFQRMHITRGCTYARVYTYTCELYINDNIIYISMYICACIHTLSILDMHTLYTDYVSLSLSFDLYNLLYTQYSIRDTVHVFHAFGGTPWPEPRLGPSLHVYIYASSPA